MHRVEMAVSLEELLYKEGFRGRRSKTISSTLSAAEAGNKRIYSFQDQQKNGASSGGKRADRVRSNISMYSSSDESPKAEKDKGWRSTNSFRHLKTRAKKETGKNYGRKFPKGSRNVANFSDGYLRVNAMNRTLVASPIEETLETIAQDVESYETMYLSEAYNSRRENQYSRGRCKQAFENDRQLSTSCIESSNKCSSSSIKIKEPEILNRKNRSSRNAKTSNNSKSRNQDKVELTIVAEPALDKAAIKALISILTGYIKSSFEEDDFRTSLRHNCYASFNFIGSNKIYVDCSVIANLEKAIETVERASVEHVSGSELKKASLLLSFITGLSSQDLKDGFTSGISNLNLSACAHLYLGVLYMLEKKDRVAAKHLLQVFSDSPFQARTHLLPELWDYVFSPQLSHLKLWYGKEVNSLKNTPRKTKMLSLLEKVYSENLDSSTYRLAIYYKSWLTEGVEALSFPSIHIPSIHELEVEALSFPSIHIPSIHELEVHQGDFKTRSSQFASPSAQLSPYPMVSKKLYDAVFGHSDKSNVQTENFEEARNYEDSASSCRSAIEDKQPLPYFSTTVEHIDQDIETIDASCPKLL